MPEYLNQLANIHDLIRNYLLPFSLKTMGAIALWIFGSFSIRILQGLITQALRRRLIDATLVTYARTTSNFILKGFLILAVLGCFGIETTSFSALLAATGVAIGMAWSGLLSNFAAGIFLIVLRPFKVGDTITAGGTTGVVREIGLFATSIDNGENLRTFVGNNKIFSDNILNYSTNPQRSLIFRIQLGFKADPADAITHLSSALEKLERICAPVTGEIIEFTPIGIHIQLKTSCHPSDHTALQALGNRIIAETLRNRVIPTPDVSASIATR